MLGCGSEGKFYFCHCMWISGTVDSMCFP